VQGRVFVIVWNYVIPGNFVIAGQL